MSSNENQRTSKEKNILRLVYFLIIIGLVLFTSRSFIKAAINEVNIRANFPILSDFETPYEKARWKIIKGQIEIASKYAKSGKNGMKVDFFPATYPSLILRDLKRNWQEFSYLKLSIFNAQEYNVELVLKVHDNQHHHAGYQYSDRFNRTITLAPGWNDLKYSLNDIKNSPKNREMDMDEIHSISLFMIKLKQPSTIYVDDVYLSIH